MNLSVSCQLYYYEIDYSHLTLFASKLIQSLIETIDIVLYKRDFVACLSILSKLILRSGLKFFLYQPIKHSSNSYSYMLT